MFRYVNFFFFFKKRVEQGQRSIKTKLKNLEIYYTQNRKFKSIIRFFSKFINLMDINLEAYESIGSSLDSKVQEYIL